MDTIKQLNAKEIDFSKFKYRHLSISIELENKKGLFRFKINKPEKKIYELLKQEYLESFGGDYFKSKNYHMFLMSTIVNNACFFTTSSIRAIFGKLSKSVNKGYRYTYCALDVDGVEVLIEHSKRGSDIWLETLPKNKEEFAKLILKIVKYFKNNYKFA